MGRTFDAVEHHVQRVRRADGRAEAVHEARKHLKRLRALYQLCREPLGRDLCKSETRLLREVAQHLAAVRDMEVRLITMRAFVTEAGLHEEALVIRLQRTWGRERDRLMQTAARAATVRGLVNAVQAARRSFAVLPIVQGDWPLVAHALTRSYRRARRGLKAALASPAQDELLHDWRKRVKVLEYQLGILRRMHPGVAAHIKRLHRLSECLGDEHDLYVLSQALRQAGPEFQQTSLGTKLRTRIRRKRSALKQKALKLGGEFFEENTRTFVREVHGWWEEWR